MGYVDFIKTSSSEKIVLIEMELGLKQQLWYNHTAGTWAYRWRPGEFVKNIGEGNIGAGNIGAGSIKNFIKIGSCFALGLKYDEKDSIVEVVAAEKSWFYDSDNFTFYIHCKDNDEPQLHFPIIGSTLGLTNYKGIYFNDLYYEPCLKSVMTVNKSRDPFFFGLISFDGGEMVLTNNDGFFDGIKSYVVTGQPVTVMFGGDDLTYEEYQIIYKGYIDDLQLNFDEMIVTIIDNRKKLSTSLPINKFSKTVGETFYYQYLDDDNVGNAIPLGYGEIYHAPVTCINPLQGTPFIFKLCDTSIHTNGIQAIDQVFVYKDDKWTAVTHGNENLTAATFTLTGAEFTVGQKVICDWKGVKNNASGLYLQNPLDIIKDMLLEFPVGFGIDYDSTNYNTTEWEEAAAHNLVSNIGFIVIKEREIEKIIEEICNCLGSFIVQDNGKFTFRIFTTDDEPIKTIYLEDQPEPFDIKWEGTEFLSSAKIGYKRNWSERNFSWYYKYDLRNKIYSEQKRHNDKSFETFLTNATDAQKSAEYMMSLFKEIPAIYTIKTKTDNMNLEILDTVNFEINRIGKPWLDFTKVSIISVVKDVINNTITFTAQHISKFIGLYFRLSPYAINVDKYAIKLSEYALSYGRMK